MIYLSILPIVIYLIFVYVKYGLQKSISESYYKLTRKEKPLFFFALVLTSMFMIVSYGIENAGTINALVLFFAGSGICYTAAASQFKSGNITESVHVVGAVGGYVLGYIFIGIEHKFESLFFIIPSLLLIVIIHLIEKSKEDRQHLYNLSAELTDIKVYVNKSIWWAEIIGFLTIYLSIIL